MQRRTYIKSVGVVSIALLLTVFCPEMHSMKQDSSLTVTKKDDGGRVQIVSGEILTLKLEAIPGTGYAWQLVQNNSNLLSPLGKATFEPISEDANKEMLGAREHQVFRFRAQNSGTNNLKLHYVRDWEKKAKPLETFSVTVHVQKGQ